MTAPLFDRIKPLPGDRVRLRSGEIITKQEFDHEKQRRKREHRRNRTDEQVFMDRNSKHPNGTKFCPGCSRHLPFTAFAPLRRELDGLNPKCRKCRPPKEPS